MGVLNFIILQWFFIRLTKCVENNISIDNITSIDFTENGPKISGRISKAKKSYWYSIQGFIVPLTGWGDDFIQFRKFFIRISPRWTDTNK